MKSTLTVMKIAAVVLIVLVLGLIYYNSSRHDDEMRASTRTNIPEAGPKDARPAAVDVPMTFAEVNADYKGQPKHLADFKNKVVHLVFWAEWCEPCREEMPELEKFKARWGDDYQVVLINMDADKEARTKALHFAHEQAPSLPVILDDEHIFENAYHVEALPMHVILDRQARIAAAFTLSISGHAEFERLIGQLLDEK